MAKWRGDSDWLKNRRPKYYGKGGSKLVAGVEREKEGL